MGATTFSMFKKSKARKMREAGREEEAIVLEESANKFRPNKKHMALSDDVMKDVEEKDEVEVDVDGDGKPDVVVKKVTKVRTRKSTKK